MYCLKVEKIKNTVGDLLIKNIVDTQFLSFEDFRELYDTKQVFDKKGNRYYKYETSVYELSNSGKEIKRLSDISVYNIINDIEKELDRSLKSYSYIRQLLRDKGIKYWCEKAVGHNRNILYVKVNNNDILKSKIADICDKRTVVLEIEMTKTTPKYEIRLKGFGILFVDNAQNEIVKVLKNEYGIDLM